MRGIPLGVALVAAALYFLGLGDAPFLDPPEGFHAVVAQEMARSGDWVTPRANGVRYFDKPPVPYWLMAGAFAIDGPTPFAARAPAALAAVGVAAVTAKLGVMLGGARLGLLAGLMVVANLGIFLFGRMVKPDLPFILCIVLAQAGFVAAYLGRRRGLGLFYAALGLATITKDVLGGVGPLAVVILFLLVTRERPLSPWVPWWGGLLLLGVALPWYLLVEARNAGFLWYTIVDNHLLNFTRQRVFPDEDVPLGALEFLLVTLLAFLPWSLALPWALRRTWRRPPVRPVDRLWVLFGLWAVVVIGFFTVSPFKLPHYGLPAFPALALLVARVWDDTIEAAPGSARPTALLLPLLVLFAAVAGVFAASWAGWLPIPEGALGSVDVATRNLEARGLRVPRSPLEPWLPLLWRGAVIYAIATAGLVVATWRRSPALGVGLSLAATIAFLPAVAGEGVTVFARSRSLAPIGETLARRLAPGDVVAHEGPFENGASLLLRLDRPVHVVDGLRSNLAFGATFPDTRAVFWDATRLERAWQEPGRIFLVTAVPSERSVVRALPPAAVHLLAASGGRALYSNLADRAVPGR